MGRPWHMKLRKVSLDGGSRVPQKKEQRKKEGARSEGGLNYAWEAQEAANFDLTFWIGLWVSLYNSTPPTHQRERCRL